MNSFDAVSDDDVAGFCKAGPCVSLRADNSGSIQMGGRTLCSSAQCLCAEDISSENDPDGLGFSCGVLFAIVPSLMIWWGIFQIVNWLF